MSFSPTTTTPTSRPSRFSWSSFTGKLTSAAVVATLPQASSTAISSTSSSTPSPPTAWSRSSSFSSLRRTSTSSLTPDSQIPSLTPDPHASLNGKSKGTLSTVMGNLSSLSLHRDRDDRRGRSTSQARPSTSDGSYAIQHDRDRRTRSSSPFTLRRRRPSSGQHTRDSSPPVGPLASPDLESDTDSLASSKRAVPRNNAFSLDDSGSEEDDFNSESSWGSEEEKFDNLTELNTERNAQTVPPVPLALDEHDIDPLGEGVNVVVPPEPLFPTTLHGTHGTRRSSSMLLKRKTLKLEHHLPLVTSRPVFQRDRCTIKLTNGDPIKTIREDERTPRRYVVASDLSIESKYAVEWCVGTVMRDGDEVVLVTVAEAENKLDPPAGTTVDRVNKLRNQQERQTLAYLLVRQVTSLLQRTRLNVSVVCQAWHAKNNRHLLLDLIDYIEPTMLIVGSRGLSKLKGILLGSTSHYLIQKSSVPVMVARRRLKRPPRRNAHLSSHRARVPLSEAAIDKAPSKVENDVEAMRDEMLKGGEEREQVEREEDEVDPEAEGGVGVGVQGVGGTALASPV